MGLVSPVEAAPVPAASLLATAPGERAYADCWSCEIAGSAGLSQLIEAFFTCPAFRPERLTLAAIGKGGSDAEARALAQGETDRFAAWTLVERREDEILLEDFAHRTRCWLAVAPKGAHTRVSFGTAILARTGEGGADRAENLAFRALVPFHRFYARRLIASAARRIA